MWWKAWIATIVLASGGLWAWAKPADLPVDQRINTAGDDAPSPNSNSQSPPTANSSNEKEARAFLDFARAESLRKKGRLAEARRGYQQAHLLAPTSDVGRRAMQRLREIENPGNEFFEEQEPPLSGSSSRPASGTSRPLNQPKPTRQQYEDMLRQTQPLGGVRGPAY